MKVPPGIDDFSITYVALSRVRRIGRQAKDQDVRFRVKGFPRSRHNRIEVPRPMKRLILPFLLAAALPAADSRIVPAMNTFTTASYKQLTQG